MAMAREPWMAGLIVMAVNRMPAAEVEVSADLVRRLLADQHPDLARLPVEFLANGWDNELYRVGDGLVARLRLLLAARWSWASWMGGCSVAGAARASSRYQSGWRARRYACRPRPSARCTRPAGLAIAIAQNLHRVSPGTSGFVRGRPVAAHVCPLLDGIS